VDLLLTVRALKHHGGAKELSEENLEALEKGIANLDKHIENMKKYNLPVVVAINRFVSDTEKELEFIDRHCKAQDVPVALCEVWAKGGEGGMALAEEVLAQLEKGTDNYTPLYDLDLSIKEKIEKIAKEIYGADGVEFVGTAKKMLKTIDDLGYGKLPVCMSKTQKSLSDNAALLGRPTGFTVSIKELRISAGAGFIVAMAGDIIDMPGLPKKPAAESIDIDENGKIEGLF
jgi:formate--tetrahydrofolate ligase